MRVEADLDLCIGAGMCARTAPGIFAQDAEDGRVQVLAEQPAPADADALREAVALCPSGALTLRDE